MRMPIDDEIKRLQVQYYTMANFLLAAVILGGIVYAVYRIGTTIFA